MTQGSWDYDTRLLGRYTFCDGGTLDTKVETSVAAETFIKFLKYLKIGWLFLFVWVHSLLEKEASQALPLL